MLSCLMFVSIQIKQHIKGYVQLERAVGKNEKLESFKLESLKLESLAVVGKTQQKLSNFIESFQVQFKLSIFITHFPTSVVLSNFARFFPTSIGSFQLRQVLSNFAWLFPTSAKLSNFRLSNLKLSNFSFFPTALSNYTYPDRSELVKFHHSDSMKTGKTALRYPLYGSDDEMAQKVIDGDNDTYQHIISYASDFEMTQNSNH